MPQVQFNDLSFDSEYLTVRRGDGAELRFTRKERALLTTFVRHPGKLLTRDRLIDALGTDPADMGERNVDLLINRLRVKLGDSARAPRLIATQYGDGYIWIAKPASDAPVDAFLLIGPVYGMSGATRWPHDIVAALTAALRKSLARDVVNMPQWRPGNRQTDDVRFSIEISFHDDSTILHAAIMLRHGPTRAILNTMRMNFHRGRTKAEIAHIASEIKVHIWNHLAKSPGAGVIVAAELPMELRLHQAAIMLARTPESWRESEAQLLQARANHPDDPELAVMWGLHLFVKLLHPLPGERPTLQQWSAVEDEIEAIALDNLAAVQDNPLLVLGVAKLLIFVDRGHFELADALAQEAFKTSTAFAAAFAILGQIRMFGGNLAEAMTLFDRGIELSEEGSEFHIYLAILKCAALLAGNNRRAVNDLSQEIYALKPLSRLKVGMFFIDPLTTRLPPDLEQLCASVNQSHAQHMIEFLYNFAGRYFQSRQHRRNVMAGLNAHMIRKFGDAIVPTQIAAALQDRSISPTQDRRARVAFSSGSSATDAPTDSSDSPAARAKSAP